MSLKEYHRISQHRNNSMVHQNKTVHKSGGSNNVRLPQLHQDYEYFQLFDPDDSEIDDEADPDVRSLLVSKLTSYTVLVPSKNKKCCCLTSWYSNCSCVIPRTFMCLSYTVKVFNFILNWIGLLFQNLIQIKQILYIVI